MDLIDIITAKPITREQLCEKTGKSDRVNRHEIHNLREKGYPIISSSRTKGYYLGNLEEYKLLRADYLSRISSYLKVINAGDKYWSEIDQLKIKEME